MGLSRLSRFNLRIDHELVGFSTAKAGWIAVSLRHCLQLYMSTAVAPEFERLHCRDFLLRPYFSVF